MLTSCLILALFQVHSHILYTNSVFTRVGSICWQWWTFGTGMCHENFHTAICHDPPTAISIKRRTIPWGSSSDYHTWISFIRIALYIVVDYMYYHACSTQETFFLDTQKHSLQTVHDVLLTIWLWCRDIYKFRVNLSRVEDINVPFSC